MLLKYAERTGTGRERVLTTEALTQIESHLAGDSLGTDDVIKLLKFSQDSVTAEFLRRDEESLKTLQSVTCSAMNLNPQSVTGFGELASAVKDHYTVLAG